VNFIIKNYKDYFDSINEGLIKTLDGEKGVNYLVQTLSVLNFNVSGRFENDIISFSINNFNKIQNNRLDDLFDTISSILTNLYGWFPSNMIIVNENKMLTNKKFSEGYLKLNKDIIESVTIQFDSKFDEIDNNNLDKLYHLSIQEYDKKIRKYGLSPRSKSKLSSHSDRVYICKSIDDCKLLIPQMKLYYSEEKDNNIYKLGNKKYRKNSKWIIYEIDNEKNIVLYKDPRYINGYYTLENINPENIKEIEKE
jgi:hypothetical protein